jgi:hypothetical protein
LINHLTHLLMFMLIVLMSINILKIENVLILIMKLIKLLITCIHSILMIFRRLYDYCKFMTSIMNRFFCVASNLIKQSYNDFESVQNTKKRNDRECWTTSLWELFRHQNHEKMHITSLRERFESRVCIWSTINERC